MVGGHVCLHALIRRPQNADVIRLSHGHMLPSSRPAGHNQCTTKTAWPQCPTNTQVPTALRGTNQRLSPSIRFNAAHQNLLERPLFVTIFTR
ncbi:hypothetical protein LF1_53980 [Rubripirellula obstinata]|uniref:Uncharacterized protein n=1 Tax=Rubripirellula obstinata TaxID=406547 RepID=A0A5B1CC61_9BACT|nr:hypothetical protein LF1_53980 [Rubripirellula obstinata]